MTLCTYLRKLFPFFLQVEYIMHIWFLEESSLQTCAKLWFNVSKFPNSEESDRLDFNHNSNT